MKTTLTLVLAASAAILAFSFRPALAASPPTAAPASTHSASTGEVEYEIDGEHSSLIFKTKHLGVSWFFGRFNELEGQLTFDEAKPENSSILVVVDAESVDTNSEGRDRHVKGADFLNARMNPEIIFESTSVSGKPAAMTIKGNLTLNGVTKAVEAKAEHTGSAETSFGAKAGFLATFKIDGRDFDIGFMKDQPGAVGPEIEFSVGIEANKK